MTAEQAVERYARVARPIILKYTDPASRLSNCVGATRVGHDVFGCLGFLAEPLAVRWIVEAPALNTAFVCGLRGEEKRQAQRARDFSRRAAGGPGPGWDGHLVLVVEGRWLIDSAFDQCAHECRQGRLEVEPTVLVVDTEGKVHPRDAEMRLMGSTDEGIGLTIHYRPLGEKDSKWRNTVAWRDPDWRAVAAEVLREMYKFDSTR